MWSKRSQESTFSLCMWLASKRGTSEKITTSIYFAWKFLGRHQQKLARMPLPLPLGGLHASAHGLRWCCGNFTGNGNIRRNKLAKCSKGSDVRLSMLDFAEVLPIFTRSCCQPFFRLAVMWGSCGRLGSSCVTRSPDGNVRSNWLALGQLR